MADRFSLRVLSILLSSLFLSPLWADEYTRFAIDSTSIQEDAANGRNFNVGGADFFLGDLGPSYGLAPFRFHPRDFSLSQVESIDSVRLTLTNEVSLDADTGMVEVFYVPDSRTDLGLGLDDDPNPEATANDDQVCSWGEPELCYNATYNPDFPGGLDPGDFSAAPQSLGVFEIDFGEERFSSEFEIDLPDAVATSMTERINAGEGFHLAFGAVDSEGFLEVGSFDRDDLGPFVRPLLSIDASGTPGPVTRDLIRSGAIHVPGDNTGADFYGSGNDDQFSEFGLANFQFTKDDFGVTDDIDDIGALQLTLYHNERNFSDGDVFEIFLVSDTAEELGYDEFVGYLGKEIAGQAFPTLLYDEELDNGINPDQFVNAPVSLGVLPYDPKFGGTTETFDLELSDEAKSQLIESINAGDDFHIVIGVTDSTHDVTFSGLNNAFDPGNPQLSIFLEAPAVDGLDLNSDGEINAADAALICEVTGGTPGPLLEANGILSGDVNFDGAVDFSDFLRISAAFGGPGTFADGDTDCNGMIEFPDFLVVSALFGQSSAAPAAVPEPSSGLLGFLALIGMASLRRRR